MARREHRDDARRAWRAGGRRGAALGVREGRGDGRTLVDEASMEERQRGLAGFAAKALFRSFRSFRIRIIKYLVRSAVDQI